MTPKLSLRLAGMTLALASTVTQASTFVESLDAPAISPGQAVGVGVDRIAGTISARGDADLYRLQLGAGRFTATTVGLAGFDTQLFLFNAEGLGLIANDDVADNVLQSSISAVLPAGMYLLGVAAYNTDPLSAAGPIFPDSNDFDADPQWTATGRGGNLPLLGWTASSTADAVHDAAYQVSLNVAVVPEPATFAMTGLGLALIGFFKRRRPKQIA